MLPSYALFELPLPVNSPHTTHFSVGCALPLFDSRGHRIGMPKLDDYLLETQRLQSQVNVVLWPETAVHFDSSAEKGEAFSKIQEVMDQHKYVGVTFEEYSPSSPNGNSRNGFALIGSKGGPIFEYYKRKLVPCKSFQWQ